MVTILPGKLTVIFLRYLPAMILNPPGYEAHTGKKSDIPFL